MVAGSSAGAEAIEGGEMNTSIHVDDEARHGRRMDGSQDTFTV